MMVYQTSYVIKKPKRSKTPSETIELVNRSEYPAIGEVVTLHGKQYRVVEVIDLIPPRAEFCYVHALVEPA